VLRRLIKGLRQAQPEASREPKLLSGEAVVEQWRAEGGTASGALALTLTQLDGLAAHVRRDSGWARLQTLVARAGDPWNAFDWPSGFDPLIVCAPLCQRVAFECTRCPVGQAQGRSCSDPVTDIGTILGMIGRAEREALLLHLAQLRAHLTALPPVRD